MRSWRRRWRRRRSAPRQSRWRTWSSGAVSSVRGAEPLPRPQKPLRVDRLAIDAGLVVQVRAGGATSRADPADDLANVHRLADLDVDARQVSVAGREAAAVLDFDHVAVAALPAGERHRAV